MKKSTGIISLVLTVAVTAGLLALAAVGVGENKTGAAKNIPLGLDLAGGVSITYQAKGDTPSAEEMNDTVYKLQKRVEGYSTEAQVYQQGDDRINIEIPGVTDANAILEELGKPGSLSFQDMSGNELLSGTDIKTAEAKAYKDNLNNTDYEVALTLTDEARRSSRRLPRPTSAPASPSYTTARPSARRLYRPPLPTVMQPLPIWNPMRQPSSWLPLSVSVP